MCVSNKFQAILMLGLGLLFENHCLRVPPRK